ncbi:MAG: WG repeat-containing protein, partial [Bacteroidetes bacterium]|nr:WG repeat-containing protein [Bacteroidota bacterium]
MKTLITIILLLASLSAFPQDYCQGILGKAKEAYQKNQLEKALSILQDAETCDYKNQLQTQRQKLQTDIFKAIEKQRREAITAKNQAERLSGFFFSSSYEPVAWAYGSNGKFGVVNRQGELQGEGFVWEQPQSFQQGYAIAQRGGDYWFIDTQGYAVSEGYDWMHPTVLPLIFGLSQTSTQSRKQEALDTLNGEKLQKIGFKRTGIEPYTPLDSSLLVFQRGDKWGMINHSGEVIIEPNYELIGDFSNGLFNFKKDGKCGFLNRKGEEIIAGLPYQHVRAFDGGFARVNVGGSVDYKEENIGGKWGFINTAFEEIVP